MKQIMDYIDSAIKELPDNKTTEKFRTNLIAEITDRANEITHAGISNEKIIDDIIISEHPDIAQEYSEVLEENKKKKKRRSTFFIHIIGTVVYFLAATFGYLFLSLTTKDWSHTWTFIVSFALAYIALVLIKTVIVLSKEENLIRNQIPRLLLPAIVFLTATIFFLVLRINLQIETAWLSYIFGVLAMFIADSVYVEIIAERFAIYFHLLYIVPAFAMIYVITAALGIVTWSLGWIMIPSSLIIVFAIILIRLIIHSREYNGLEVEEECEQEN